MAHQKMMVKPSSVRFISFSRPLFFSKYVSFREATKTPTYQNASHLLPSADWLIQFSPDTLTNLNNAAFPTNTSTSAHQHPRHSRDFHLEISSPPPSPGIFSHEGDHDKVGNLGLIWYVLKVGNFSGTKKWMRRPKRSQ